METLPQTLRNVSNRQLSSRRYADRRRVRVWVGLFDEVLHSLPKALFRSGLLEPFTLPQIRHGRQTHGTSRESVDDEILAFHSQPIRKSAQRVVAHIVSLHQSLYE